MSPFTLDVFFSVKHAKNDVYIPQTNKIKENLKLGKECHIHEKLKGKVVNPQNGISKSFKAFNNDDIVVSCENIKCEIEERTFLIHHLLREEVSNELNNKIINMLNNVSPANTRTKGRI